MVLTEAEGTGAGMLVEPVQRHMEVVSNLIRIAMEWIYM